MYVSTWKTLFFRVLEYKLGVFFVMNEKTRKLTIMAMLVAISIVDRKSVV